MTAREKQNELEREYWARHETLEERMAALDAAIFVALDRQDWERAAVLARASRALETYMAARAAEPTDEELDDGE